MSFRIDLNMYRGPLDLLLYLVRKHEVEIAEIPIAAITEQYLNYLAVLEQMDVDAVGDFLSMASTLIEVKSQQVLPRADEIQDELEDPRKELVQQLLEYKKYRDAASILEEQSRSWQRQFPRQASDLPPRQRNLAEEPIREVELWDLVSAFGRIIRESDTVQPKSIVYDETPIGVHMARAHQRLLAEGRVAFRDLFQPGMHKSGLIGVFLAILELVRHEHAYVDQDDLFGEIVVLPHEKSTGPLDLSDVDNYDHASEPEPDADAEA